VTRAFGVFAAALVVGVCVTVAYGLSTGFQRAASQADLPDVIVRFDTQDRAKVDARLRTIPGLEARSYRYEVTDVPLTFGSHFTGRGSVHVVTGGRRGYAIVPGRDARPGAREIVVEPGRARAWGITIGSTLDVGSAGALRVVGEGLEPDNVAFPVATAARVYLRPQLGGDFGVNLAQLWLRPGASLDAALTQARAQSFGVHGLSFITRTGVRALVGQAAGVVIALLVAFSLVALGVAAVMLGTAAHAEVRRGLASLGVRRALGFPRRMLARAAARRAALRALPAAALGLAAGWLAARGPSASLLATLNERPPGAAILLPLAACLAGVVVLVVAAATWPTWRATAGAPAALLRGGELAGRTATRLPLGSTPAALGARLVVARRGRYAGVVVLLAACAAVALLMLALASLLARLRDDPATLGKRYQLTVGADPSASRRIAQIPGVAAAAPRWQLSAVDSFALGEPMRIIAFPGDHTRFEAPPLASGRRLRGDGEAEVGSGLADALGLAPGGTLGIQLADGREVRFRVAGVVRALDNQGRIAYVAPGRLKPELAGLSPEIAVRLTPGADRGAVADRLSQLGLEPSQATGATGSGSSATVLDVLSAVLRVLAGAVGAVLLYALVQALALTATERRPTLALLRALGAPARTLGVVLGGAGLALVLPAAILAVLVERAVLGPLVARLTAGYADLALGATAGQAALVAAGLLVLAAAAAAWVGARARRAAIAPALRR